MSHIPRLLAAVLALSSLSSSSTAQPNPALLPTASTSHTPQTAAYNALNVPGKTAGTFYLDPTSQARVYKLTDNSFPTPGLSWGHDYSEGNDEVSLPYTVGSVSRRSILVRELQGPNWVHWLIDFRPGTSPAISNPRLLPAAWNWKAIAFTFSNNPATPHLAYYVDGNTIKRMDIATLTDLPGGGFPLSSACSNGERPSWFHQSKNDGMFVWMCGDNGPVVAAYKPALGLKREFTVSGINEPRIDRDGRFIGISMTTPQNAMQVWDWDEGLTQSVWTVNSGSMPFAHQASMRGRWYSVDWNITHPAQFTKFDPFTETATYIGGPAHSDLSYGSGNWVQPSAALDSQWALFSHYGSLQPSTNPGWLAPGAMFFLMENGQRRHTLGHPYNTSGEYDRLSFAKPSSDGHFVLFTSDMNGSGRTDVFLAEVPTGGAEPTPTPTPVGPTPTPTPTPSSCGWSRIEQDAPSVVYTGASWFTINNGVHSGGSAKEGMDTGYRATLTFAGTGVRWIAYRDEWAGIARVFVDGVDQGTFDTYRTPHLAQATMFEKTGLASGSHTLAIEVTGQKNASSGGYWIWVDAFELQNGCAPTPTPTPTPTPPPAQWNRIEQNHSSVVYTGTQWFTVANGVHSGGSANESMDAGHRATVTFTGTGVRWIAYRDEWAGIARVYVDGVDQGTVDTYRTPHLAQTVMFEKTNLAAGSHTMAIEVTGQKNAASGGYWIWVDAFEIRQ